ncbi:MAG: hypothetical protein ABIM30_00540 [candidate division WOR-3 bacterium]
MVDRENNILHVIFSVLDKGASSKNKLTRVMSKVSLFAMMVGVVMFSLISYPFERIRGGRE